MSVDPKALAEFLSVKQGERVDQAAAAASSWVEKRRSATDPVDLWLDPAVAYGGVLYGALLYQSRSTPQGFAGYDETGVTSQSQEALFRARDLVGSDPVVA
jgi:hypothetical protein